MSQRRVISVIVPVYNIEKYIGECIESIQSQTYANLEIILVNDGSTDSSGAICDEYARKDSRIKVIHKKNDGVSSARNSGLEAASGKYVGFVDGDDSISEDMYEKLLETIRNEEIASCFLKGDQSIHIPESIPKVLTVDKAIPCLLQNFCFSNSCCDKLFRRDLIGNTRFRTDIYHNEDLLFLYEVLKKGRTITLTESICYFYRHREGSAVHSAFNDKKQTLLDAWDWLKKDADGNHFPWAGIVAEQRFRNNISCALDIARSNYGNREVIARIRQNVRKDFIPLLGGRLAAGYKIEALLLIANWQLFKFVNRRLKKA